MYVNESIPVKQLNSHKDDSETLFLEINLRLRKWMIVGAYKHPDQGKSVALESLSKSLSIYLDKYENVILLGDFNMNPEDKNVQLFVDSFKLEHLTKKPTCFKGSPFCIDLIIRNRISKYFKNTCILETGITDKLTALCLKSQISKAPLKRKLYRDYKAFDENYFNNNLKTKLDSVKIQDYSSFKDIFINVLNTHANNHEFMAKALRKAIMTRSRLKNVNLKSQNTTN